MKEKNYNFNLSNDKLILTFNKSFIPNRTAADEKEIIERVMENGVLIIDFSDVKIISPSWMRFFGVLSLQIKRRGNFLRIVGANESIKILIDQLGLSDILNYTD